MAQISLGTAQSFGVLAGSTVTNTGSTTVTGNLGVSPGTAVTGFPPGTVTGGTIHLNDAAAAQAQSDVTTAYNAIAGTACNVDLTGQNLGGLTLTPGVYCFSSSAQLTGTLTLNALGNPNALFIFKIGSSLTTASSSSVQVINGGNNCNVYWQVGSSATLGTSTSFVGNILALTSITLTTGANVSGRVLARNGAVTMDTNNVTVCGPASACPIITVNPATLPNGVVGTPYSQTVSAVGGTAPFTFTVSSGALPSGLTLNATTGVISGTPTAAGTFNFTITATDANSCPGSRPYSIMMAGAPGCPVITVNPATLPPGVIGTPYSQTVSATGGTAPFTFAVSSGALPNGLTLNATTGIISGTPTTAGQFSFTISATDANGCPGSRPYSIVIPVVPICPFITVNPATLPAGVIGTPYSQTISAIGGTPPFTFTVSSGFLPPVLTLNATTGVISGTPTTAGQFSFTITATDANGCPGSRAYTIGIPSGPNCPVISVSPATLPPGVVGTFYSQTVAASGGTAPFTFTVSSGGLPPGLTLNPATGVISGTPTAAGTFNFTITATDSSLCTGSLVFSIQITGVPPPPPPPPPPGGAVPTLSEWGAILMALLIIAACTFFLAGHSKAAMSLAGAVPSTAFTGAEKPLDWKLLARTAMYVEAAIALALIALSANPVDILGALTSGLVAAFILHLLIGGARRR
ncbi:MAG: putative Ig domain-containing protein [Acidobacteriota bacterium]